MKKEAVKNLKTGTIVRLDGEWAVVQRRRGNSTPVLDYWNSPPERVPMETLVEVLEKRITPA